jgi:hypothetical protein
MAVFFGFAISGLIAVAIFGVGLRFFLTPYVAAAGFGVAVEPELGWDAYLSAKAIRDIASGLFAALLIISRQTHLLGWFMLTATLIPVADAAIVLRHGGAGRTAYAVHCATAMVMLLASALLLAR